MNVVETTRYTATLPASFLEELKALVKEERIPSVNFAIRQAVDEYLAQIRKQQYEDRMKEAAKDVAFITRTMKCNKDFCSADSEVDGEW